jgi:hypothetical protein
MVLPTWIVYVQQPTSTTPALIDGVEARIRIDLPHASKAGEVRLRLFSLRRCCADWLRACSNSRYYAYCRVWSEQSACRFGAQ